MPNRLSKILSRSSYSNEKEVEAEAGRNESNSSTSPPPGYTTTASQLPDYDGDNRLDPPDVTAGFRNLSLSPSANDTPQVDHCIAHLKVLECFYRLRQSVGSTDGFCGINDSIVTDSGLDDNESKRSEALAKLAEKRWACYVSRAVDRFEHWMSAMTPAARHLTSGEFEKRGPAGNLCDPSQAPLPPQFNKDNMPPADVLLVWHAYMLNPRDYLEDCLRMGRMHYWHAGFPWKVAMDCINDETFVYETSAEATNQFEELTGLPSNQTDFAYPSVKVLHCPVCSAARRCPWTTAGERLLGRKYSTWDSLSEGIDDALSGGSGWCDRGFAISCGVCQTAIDHDRLNVGKLCDDVKRLLHNDAPMGGTLLGYEGIPWKYGKTNDTMFAYWTSAAPGPLANPLLKHGLGQDIITYVKSRGNGVRMAEVRTVIETKFLDRTYMKTVRGSAAGRMQRADRVSVRKMMSR